MRDNNEQKQPTLRRAVIPELPDNSPERLEQVVREMVQDLGLDDVAIVDLRNADPPSSFGPNAIMVVASGKSDKHLVRAATELSKWIKNQYNVIVDQEGLLTSNFSKVRQRRMRKKAARQSTFYVKENDNVAMKTANSWVALDTKVDGIYVHLFTPERRRIVNLEEVWQDYLGQEEQSVNNTNPSSAEMPGLRREYHTSAAGYYMNSIYSMQRGRAFGGNSLCRKPNGSYAVPGVRKYHSERTLEEYCELGDYKNSISAVQLHNVVDKNLLVLKAHINHVQTIASNPGDRAPLKRSSPVVQSFMSCLPSIPDAEHWCLRLVFLQSCHFANPADFPLQMLVDYLMFQQAVGIPVSDWDVEVVVTTIAYSNELFNLSGHVEMKALNIWTKQCDCKFNLILQVMDIAHRPSGKPFSASNTLLSLMYRLCIRPTNRYITYENAIEDCTPTQPKRRGVLDPRAFSIAHLFKNFQIASDSNKTLMALVMTALANEQEWREFWSLWDRIVASGNIDHTMLLFMTSLVTKASNEEAIASLLDNALPNVLLQKGTSLCTPELVTAINHAMDFINPKQDSYKHLRAYIQRFNEREAPPAAEFDQKQPPIPSVAL
ncbi:hypothetical protein TRICI_001270 [Trichomonascus ciferrii]|uniref:ATPase synthesis protein 25 n=1 Tax=Trichomonascus ciferrii TaxID=44093 RepID=A0A642VCR1_9ASCO|nr:hypothetical protein TRICI_001270 [Trichomonascus ciferrii]